MKTIVEIECNIPQDKKFKVTPKMVLRGLSEDGHPTQYYTVRGLPSQPEQGLNQEDEIMNPNKTCKNYDMKRCLERIAEKGSFHCRFGCSNWQPVSASPQPEQGREEKGCHEQGEG